MAFFPPVNNSKCGSSQPHSVSHMLQFFIAYNLKHMHGRNELEHSVMVSIHLPSSMSKGSYIQSSFSDVVFQSDPSKCRQVARLKNFANPTLLSFL